MRASPTVLAALRARLSPGHRHGRAYHCAQLWQQQGVSREFLLSNPDGPSWDCSVCPPGGLSAIRIPITSVSYADLNLSEVHATISAERCIVCSGYPPDHPECAGVPFAQNFPDIPRAMWYTFVTVTTVGYGDVTPKTWEGQIFGALIILCAAATAAAEVAAFCTMHGHGMAAALHKGRVASPPALPAHLIHVGSHRARARARHAHARMHRMRRMPPRWCAARATVPPPPRQVRRHLPRYASQLGGLAL